MSELFVDGSGEWNSSQAQMKATQETTRSVQDDVKIGPKADVVSAKHHGADSGDQDHHDLQSPKNAEQKADWNPPKKQNPFV